VTKAQRSRSRAITASAATRDASAQVAQPAKRQHKPTARRLYATIAAAGVVIGTLTAATGFFDWVMRTASPASPPAIDARLEAVRERNHSETLGDYLRETRQPTHAYSRAQLDQPGEVFALRLRIVGEEGKRLPLRWAVYHSNGQLRLRGPIYNQVAAMVEAHSQDHARTWPVWVPAPPRPGAYFVRFTLQDEQQQPVDERDSPSFRTPA
jgi:hypothetical protein